MKKHLYSTIILLTILSFGARAQITVFPYCEDFESGDGDWIAGGMSSTWEYGTPAGAVLSGANSGSNCWLTNLDGSHNNLEESYLMSPAMDFSELYDPVVGMYIKRDLQQGMDGVAFQYSTDGGATWELLGVANTPNGWYDDNSINGLTGFGVTEGWTGYDSLWVFTSESLDTIAGATNVRFRLIMGTDAVTVNEGFGFDDFIIAESMDIYLSQLIVPDSVCGSSGDEIQAVICNNSVEPISGFSVYLEVGAQSMSTTFDDTLDVCSCGMLSLFSLDSLHGGNYNVTAYASTANDVNHNNDTLRDEMYIYEFPDAYFTGTAGNYCEGDSAEVVLNIVGAPPVDVSYTDGHTLFEDEGVSYTTKEFNVTKSSGFTVLNIVDGSGCISDPFLSEDTLRIKFHPIPRPFLGKDTVGREGPLILDAGKYNEYHWNNGDSSRTIDVIESGSYSVTVANAGGCTGSDTIRVTLWPLGVSETMTDGFLTSYPNPVLDQLYLKAHGDYETLELSISNISGAVVWKEKWNNVSNGSAQLVPVDGLAAGMYILNYNNGNEYRSVRFVKR